jgi:hypothetical protein
LAATTAPAVAVQGARDLSTAVADHRAKEPVTAAHGLASRSASFAVDDGVLYGKCSTTDYSVSVTLPEGAASWRIHIVATGDGAYGIGTDDYQAPLYGGTTYAGYLEFCPTAAPGAYLAEATIEYLDYGSRVVATEETSDFFSMRGHPTRTYLSVSSRSPRFNSVVHFTIDSEEKNAYGSWSLNSRVPVQLQVREDNGEWVVVKRSNGYTGRLGSFEVGYRWNLRQALTFRAKTVINGSDRGSVSRLVTIKAR